MAQRNAGRQNHMPDLIGQAANAINIGLAPSEIHSWLTDPAPGREMTEEQAWYTYCAAKILVASWEIPVPPDTGPDCAEG